AGFFILGGIDGFFPQLIDATYAVLMNATTVWVILVAGLFGGLVALVEISGGTTGFSSAAERVAKGEKSTLLVTWLLGIAVFADDYLNALAVGTAMRKLADKYTIAREKLAYVVNSTGASVCVIIPVSTWAAFMASQLELSGAAPEGGGTAMYLQTIPYLFYAFAAVIAVPLFIFKVVPTFGPMKQAELRAKGGQTVPDSMLDATKEEEEMESGKKPNVWNFVIPMILLIAATIYFQDMLYGVIIGIASCFILYLPQKVVSLTAMCEAIIKGFAEMVFPLMIVVAAFILQNANDSLGLTSFVIDSVAPILSPVLLPMIAFIIVALLAFCTGSFWGVAAIAFPIIVPLSQTMDVNTLLVCGSVISGAVFGSHTCFYSDAATLTCAACQIKNIDYAKTVLPLIAVPFVLAIIAFLIAGVTMA
ncbi:MAG: sodium:proton antiporter, partial [Clostridiales Family XIII bacterium]|nr:sodium:proton antiporter [Clostridiales Family XIII bacterium]